MAVFPLSQQSQVTIETTKNVDTLLREQIRRKKVVNLILLAIFVFQLIGLPGAIMMHSMMSIGTVLLGLALCGLALMFNYLGKVTIVSILLIVVVDLGCGLMLLTTPMGLDVSDLPVFDILIVSELISVSLLPARSVFPVALSNILFILADIALQPRTPALHMVLMSDMAYNAVAQPVSLQIVVAVISFIWVRNAQRALARADRAEEIAELQKREVERSRQLDEAIAHLSQLLTRAANGDRTVRANLTQDNVLWRIGNSINLLLTRQGRVGLIEQENRHLHGEVARLTEALHVAHTFARHRESGSFPQKRTL